MAGVKNADPFVKEMENILDLYLRFLFKYRRDSSSMRDRNYKNKLTSLPDFMLFQIIFLPHIGLYLDI